MNDFGLSDDELFPLLDEAGAANLRRLREHPHAPRYNWRTGERVTSAGLANVRTYAERVASQRTPWEAGRLPPWVMPFVATCRRDVPFYRARETWSDDDFHALPLTRRDDIRRRPWSFVPDGHPLDGLITYTTSGTTGTRLQIPATAELPNRYLPLLEHALSTVGVRLERGRRVSIVHACAQRGTVVLCSISSYLGGAGFVKVNLDPSDWNDPADAARFLDDCDAQVYTGDPFALSRLTEIPLRTRPAAIVSAGTSLSGGMRERLSNHFNCPVIDLYSLNESGPVAFSIADGNHEILPPDVYVEIVDEAGRPCAPGARGEIVLTGGLNPCLPLVRYATGDFASITHNTNGMPRLTGLQGRGAISFRTARGEWINSVDVTTALSHVPLPYVSLHQSADSALTLHTCGDEDAVSSAESALRALFGESQSITTVADTQPSRSSKPIAYSTDLAPPNS